MKYNIHLEYDNPIIIEAESLDGLCEILFNDYKDEFNDAITPHYELTLFKTQDGEVYVRYTEDRYMGYYYLDIVNSGTEFESDEQMELDHTEISIDDLTLDQFKTLIRCGCSATEEYGARLFEIHDEKNNDIYYFDIDWLY
jgi:hypothetical protein